MTDEILGRGDRTKKRRRRKNSVICLQKKCFRRSFDTKCEVKRSEESIVVQVLKIK